MIGGNDEDYDPFVITFLFNSRNILYGFTAKGTTGFIQYGFDIIAAGVSALIVNVIHSIEYLTSFFDKRFSSKTWR